jgi:potassium efflux system protein
LILLIVVYYLKRRSHTWLDKDNASHESVILILSRPISVAFIIALSLTTTIYPNAPGEIIRLYNTLILIPLLRILPGLLPKTLRKPLYYLVALFILHRLHDQAFEQLLLQRILLLIMTIATLGWTFWLIKPGGPVFKLGEGRLLRSIILIGRISLALLGIGILGNIFGYVSLATLITSAFLKSIYIGVALYTLLRIVEALLTLIMKTKIAQSLQMVRRHSSTIVSRVQIFFQFAAFIFWLYSILNYYTVFNPLWKFISSILNKKLGVGDLNISLGDVIAFILTIWISILISRFVRFILDEDVYPRLKLSRGVPATISLLINYSIITLGFVAAISAAGMEWSKLAILAGALGVGIGFGLQNLVNNFVSGLILIFERPIKVGDTIEFGTLLGRVLRIGIRSSTVRTYEGAEVIVPNGNIISSEVVNWTLSDKLRRIEILVGVAYGTDPEKVINILKGIVAEHDSILKNPEPVVLFTEFGDSSLNFSLRFWTADFEEWLNLKSEITVLVNKALKEANIEIPFPQRDLHLRSVDPEISKELKAKDKKTEE